MELCGDSRLSYPIIPLPVEVEIEEKEDLQDTANQTGDDQGVEPLATECDYHKEELMSCLERSTGEISALCSSHLKEMEKKMEKQFQYLHDQVHSTINWRLKQYHVELLKDIKSVIQPMAHTLQHMEGEHQYTVRGSVPYSKHLHSSSLPTASQRICTDPV